MNPAKDLQLNDHLIRVAARCHSRASGETRPLGKHGTSIAGFAYGQAPTQAVHPAYSWRHMRRRGAAGACEAHFWVLQDGFGEGRRGV